MRVHGTRRTIKMRFEHFGDLWVGDYHHGPLIRLPSGRTTTAKLGAFIDHCTRYPVADRYYAAEDISTLRDTLLRALLRWGPPKKVYVDRGAVYRSRQLAAALHAIKTILVHSRPYYSQGRGVIEKWWQVIAPFEAEVAAREELLGLHELNAFWEAYREERYCHDVHSELGRTPAEAVASLSTKVERRSIESGVLGTLFMISEDRRVHRKDACVSVLGQRFLCESFLRGRKVKVRFDPSDLSFVEIFLDGERVQRAFPQPINATPEPHPEPEQVTQSVDYLALIRRDYDRRLLEHARPLAYADLRIDEGFGAEQFVEVLSSLAGLRLRAPGRAEVRSLWETFGPLPEELVRIGCEHAVRMHGRGRHPRVYLDAIRTLALAHWRGADDPEDP